MNKTIGVFLLLGLFIPLFLGAESYIMVTSTKNVKTLNKIKAKMKTMGLKPVHKRTKKAYVIYSGPYKDTKEASIEKRKISKYFSSAKIIDFSSKASATQNRESKESTNIETVAKQKDGLHIGASVGYASAKSTITGDETKINILPDTSGLTYGINLGYTFSNGVDVSLAYMIADTNSLTYTNVYGLLNYRYYNSSDFTPYIGFGVGYSSLTWDIKPITDASAPDSTSSMYGVQMGVVYNLNELIGLNLNYNGMMMDHVANIIDTDESVVARIEHSLIHSIFIGVELYF